MARNYPYTRQTWTDGSSVANASRLGHIEDGIYNAAGALDLRAMQPDPIYASHRGSPRYPENTVEGMQLAMAEGVTMIEFDLYTTLDDVPVVMHDSTVDRTTTGTGSVSGFLLSTFKKLTIDMALYGPEWAGQVVHPPSLEDMLIAFADKVYLSIETKDDRSAQLLPTYLDKYLQRPTNVICNGASITRMQPCVDAGYPTAIQDTSTAASTLAGYGLYQVNGAAASVNAARVTALHDAGLKAGTFNIARQYDRDAEITKGVDQIMTDDVAYVSRSTPLLTSDPWATQAWFPGHIGATVANGGEQYGRFTAPNKFGFDNNQGVANCESGVLCGWASPIKGSQTANSFVINYTMTHNNSYATSSNGSVAFSNQDNNLWGGGDTATINYQGYACVVRKDGVAQIRYYPGGGGYSTLANFTRTGGTLSDGVAMTLRITVTATSITFRDVGTAQECTTNDTTLRGGYLCVGSGGMDVAFSGMAIT